MITKLQHKQKQMKKAAIAFANGTPMKEVLEEYGVSYASVYNAIKRYDIKYEYTYGRTIFFNQNFFNDINSEEKAYWLGFLYADGSVVKSDKNVSDYNRVQLALSIKDIDHLSKFAKAIDYPVENFSEYTPPNSYTSSRMVYMQCNSLKMASDLINVGCVPAKTSKLFVPEIPKNLIRHFIRGFFDGDGSIHAFRRVNKMAGLFSITTCSNDFLYDLQTILMDKCGLNRTKLTHVQKKNAYLMCYGGRLQLIRIFHYLYNDSTIYMQRKYDKFSLLLS